MDNLVAGNLVIYVTPGSNYIRLDWRGKANDRQPAKALAPFFAKIVELAAEQHRAIQMHFENLEYFNSITISSVIQLILQLREKKIALAIFYAPNLKWQKLGIQPLRILAKDDRLLTFTEI